MLIVAITRIDIVAVVEASIRCRLVIAIWYWTIAATAVDVVVVVMMTRRTAIQCGKWLFWMWWIAKFVVHRTRKETDVVNRYGALGMT